MPKRAVSKKVNPAIMVAIIALIGTIISSLLASPILLAKFQASATRSSVAVNQSPDPTLITSSSNEPEASLLASVLKSDIHSDIRNLGLPCDTFAGPFILPEDIDFEANPETALNKVITTLQTDKANTRNWWPQISSMLTHTIDLYNIQEAGGAWVKVEGKAQSQIVSYLPIRSHVDALCLIVPGIPVTGGGSNYVFSPVWLDSRNWKSREFPVTLEEFDFVSLQPGEFGAFQFETQCKDSGVYKMHLNLQISYSGQSFPLVSEPVMDLYCPGSLTLWHVYHEDKRGSWWEDLGNEDFVKIKVEKLGNFVLQDGQYQEVP